MLPSSDANLANSSTTGTPEYYAHKNSITQFIIIPIMLQKKKILLVVKLLHATYSVYYISVGSSTCFWCRHPTSGAPATVIAPSGID